MTTDIATQAIVDTRTRLDTHLKIESPLLRALHQEMKVEVDREIVMTLRVAVLTADKASRAEIIRTLGISEAEARMALERLATVAQRWRQDA